ncbi:MAG: hypothetical protein ACYDD2_02085 [Candidatus Acidiferrales bacterium]
MFNLLLLCLGALFRLFRSRRDLVFENLVLRQQLAVLKRRRPRASLSIFDKLFWIVVRRFWSQWKRSLIVVTPETVIRWHRAGFQMYGRLISKVRRQVGRTQTPKEVRELIVRMVRENPTGGAPRIHGELLMLGFDVSERTISRCMRRAPRDPEPAKRWLAFLHNHREAIAAVDFFTVPTITFGVLCGFFVIAHDRRRILHFNVTRHPTSLWVVQQLREAFPFESAPRFLISDRDGKYGGRVPRNRSIPEDRTRAYFVRKPLAERWRSAGWKAVGATSANHLAQIERGTKRPSFELIFALAAAFSVSPVTFFLFERDEKDEKILRRKINGLLDRYTAEQLGQTYRYMKFMIGP